MKAQKAFWRSFRGGTVDTSALIQSALDVGEATVKLPEGIFKVSNTLTVHTHQRLKGTGIGGRVGERGTLLQYDGGGVAIKIGDGAERGENCQVSNLRLRGPFRNEDPDVDVTRGIQVGAPTSGYDANHFLLRNVVIERFDVGYDSYRADGCQIDGGFISGCNINGRTGQNAVNMVSNFSSFDAAKVGWWITSGGLDFRCGVFSGGVSDFFLATGAALCVQSGWFEGNYECVEMSNNSIATFIACRRVWQSGSQPLFVRGQNGALNFIACNGGTELSFDVMSGMAVTGLGEPGTKNGLPYTAGSY